jgi:hypothetical protein
MVHVGQWWSMLGSSFLMLAIAGLSFFYIGLDFFDVVHVGSFILSHGLT